MHCDASLLLISFARAYRLRCADGKCTKNYTYMCGVGTIFNLVQDTQTCQEVSLHKHTKPSKNLRVMYTSTRSGLVDSTFRPDGTAEEAREAGKKSEISPACQLYLSHTFAEHVIFDCLFDCLVVKIALCPTPGRFCRQTLPKLHLKWLGNTQQWVWQAVAASHRLTSFQHTVHNIHPLPCQAHTYM